MRNSDPRMLGFLGRGLSFELSAVQQYLTHARLADNWGMERAASQFRMDAQEEMGHANRLIARMLSLGVAPNASSLRPVVTGQDLREVLRANWHLEAEIVSLYEQASHYCERSGDSNGQAFFWELLREEQEHTKELERWLSQLTEPGAATGARS